jgi:D-aspartate ligase
VARIPSMNTQAHAIVIGLDNMTGLQTSRILARHGVPVIAIAKDPTHFCCRTNVCEKILKANTSGDELLVLLLKLGPQLPQKAVLFPCTDLSVLTISRNRTQLSQWYHIMLAEPNVIETLMDKVKFYTFAAERGLPIPRTFFLRSRADAEQAAREIPYPCILKPPIKTPTWERNSKSKAFKIENAQELLDIYDSHAAFADLLMVQEWVDGTDADLFTCNGYWDADSKPLAAFVSKKIRQWPPETGTGCIAIEYRNDEVLHETLRLFAEVKYRGLGYVEMKRDSRTGKHYIIEPNIGRPTGRSAISEAGGVELIYTMYCDVLGLPLPPNREQRYTGVKWIDLRRDAQSAFYYWRRGELSLGDWLRSWRGRKAHAIFDWRDPKPFIGDITRAISLSWGAVKRKLLRRLGLPTTAKTATQR